MACDWWARGACHRARIRATRWLAHPAGLGILPRSRDALRPRFAKCFANSRGRTRPSRGRGEARVHAAPAVSRARCQRRTRTRAYRFSGGSPAFPAQWLYGFLRALPGDRLVCHRYQRDASIIASLTPASGRQDHTTSPYASAPFVLARSKRPPHPVPTLKTMANAPLAGRMAP